MAWLRRVPSDKHFQPARSRTRRGQPEVHVGVDSAEQRGRIADCASLPRRKFPVVPEDLPAFAEVNSGSGVSPRMSGAAAADTISATAKIDRAARKIIANPLRRSPASRQLNTYPLASFTVGRDLYNMLPSGGDYFPGRRAARVRDADPPSLTPFPYCFADALLSGSGVQL